MEPDNPSHIGRNTSVAPKGSVGFVQLPAASLSILLEDPNYPSCSLELEMNMLSSLTDTSCLFYPFHGINMRENLSCCTACELFDGSVKVKFVAGVELRYRFPAEAKVFPRLC